VQRAYQVVVVVAAFIMQQQRPLSHLFERLNLYGGGVARCIGGHLEQIERPSGVPVGIPYQKRERLGCESVPARKPPLLRKRLFHKRLYLLVLKRPQDKDLAARQKRRYHLEGGVLGGGTDEGYGAILNVGQERILLGLVEAVDFIDEEDGSALAAPPCGGDNPPNIAHPACDR